MTEERYSFFYRRFIEEKEKEKSIVEDTQIGLNKYNSNRLWTINNFIALGELIFNKDTQAAKQRFYNCGLLAEYLNKEYEHSWLGHGQLYLLYTVMSDNEELITRVGSLTHPNQKKVFNKNAGVISTCIQCVIREDWEELKGHIQFLQEQNLRKKPKFSFPGLYATLYEAFMNKDKGQIEKLLINDFEGTRFKQSMKSQFAYEHFISQITLGYAKLAQFIGIDVEIESPLIPKEMISFQPIDNYEVPYWFLNSSGLYNKPKETIVYDKTDTEYKDYLPKPLTENEKIQVYNILKDARGENGAANELQNWAQLIIQAYTDPETFDRDHKDFNEKYNQLAIPQEKNGVVRKEPKPMSAMWAWAETEQQFIHNLLWEFIVKEIDENYDVVWKPDVKKKKWGLF